MEGKEVAKVDPKELAVFNEDLGFSGFEGVENDAESFAIPFLKIVNKMSSIVDQDSDDYDPEAKNGDFYNSVTGEIYGRSFDAIVVYSERVFNEYKPDRKGFVGTHNKDEGRALIRDKGEYPFINKNTLNELSETQTLILLNANDIEAGVIVFPMASKQLKHAKAFLSKTTMLKMEKIVNGVKKLVRAPLFSSIYRFETRLQENEKGKWYQVLKSSITRLGNITADMGEPIKQAYALFKAEGVDYSKAEDDKAVQSELDFGDIDSQGGVNSEDKPF